ncbi:proline dehydrogenase family protein [Desulforhopalus sp. IMCC35007]|uniref:proline dehydrogenase family protein n=1 Tax=Desulforhopalus sp. IMCC35007 TaxID=2569543 RepID=UPI0010AEDF55|nr:proline dehydrogenase family protein [Desulforhopalus sp. IMCC35007]TKB11628.1 proline dehydrogenase [Desulforhopalus sp. IMCC35007]
MINSMIAGILPYMPKKLVWMFSKEYIAGQTIEEAIVNAKKLNAEGVMTTIDVLGEFITTLEEAENNKNEYLQVVDAAEKAGVDGNYSLKPTFFGLLIDKDVAYTHIREVVAKAASYNNFVRIDMEDSPCTDMEIEMYRKLKEEFPRNVGLVVQSCLRRTHRDIENLKAVNTEESPVNLRVCKGIYVEPEAIAYKKYEEINAHFLRDVELMFQEKMYPGIATHDTPLIEGAFKLIEKYNVPKESYEFQMLYGVTPALRKSIVDKGHRMRVYVPFGKDWFGYSTRRLKENPKMAGVVLKALFKKG